MNASMLGLQGGVLTPAFAFGNVLERRLSEVGMIFSNEGSEPCADPMALIAALTSPSKSKL